MALIHGVRKFVNVRDLDIDLIDRINPFEAAYSVLAKAMNENTLRQVQATIAAKRISIPLPNLLALVKGLSFLPHDLHQPILPQPQGQEPCIRAV